MQPPAVPAASAEDDKDWGRSPQSLKATLAISKIKSKAEDDPLPPACGPRILSKYWLTRAYLSLALLVKVAVIAWEPTSLTHTTLLGNTAGWSFMGVLMTLAVIGCLDVVINDLLPPGYSFPWAREYRHWIYTLMASSFMCLTYAIFRERGFCAVMLTYWVDAAAAVAVANFDLFARRRGV
jgi:hypothetical protein